MVLYDNPTYYAGLRESIRLQTVPEKVKA